MERISLAPEVRERLRGVSCPTCGAQPRTTQLQLNYDGLADDALPDPSRPKAARFTCAGKPSHRWTLDLLG